MSTRKQMQIPSTTLAVDTVTIATTTTKNTAASALEVFETADATNVNVTSTTTPEATSLLTAAASTATTTTSTANISLQLPYDNLNKAEMGGNVSSEFESALQESDSANSKQEGKIIQLTSNRVTRSSPLLPNSPVNRKSDQMNNLLEINECNNSENEEMSCAAVVPKRVNQIRARKSIKEAKELQQQQQQQQQQHPDKTYTKEDNNSEQKEAKDKDVKDATTTIASRLTRKSLALQEVACINTRVTRQQRQSTTNRSEARSETPPARSKVIRGNVGRGKMSLPNSNEAAICKRKRSLDTRCLSTEEPLIKCIKTETKEDFDDDDEEFLSVSHITNASSTDSSIGETPSKIKQEILEESENESESVTVSTGAIVDGGEVGNVCGGSTSNIAKGRNNKSGSNSGKKSGACIISLSPSTRSTRQTKSNSPAASSSAKRTRITTNSRCVLRNTVGGGNNNNKKQRLPSNITDDDELSKDGSVYSNITDDVILANIKSELTENDTINNNNNDSSIAQNVVEEHERPKEKNTAKSPIKQSSNNITVIISNTQMDISKVNLTNSLTTEKISYSNSLKPLINNVNEHAKQSECLENDIDIRKNPKINAITEGKQTNTTSGDSHTSVKIVEVNNPDNSLKQEGTSCFNDDKNNSNKKLFSTQLNVVLEDNDNLMDNDDEPVLIINEDDLPEEEDNQRYVKNNEPIGEHYELHNEDLIINENKCISMDNNDPADITFENVEPQDTTPLINKEHEIEKINTNKNANIIKFTNDEIKSAVNDTPDKIDNESEKLDEYVKENLSKIDKPDESDNSSDAIAKDDDATETLKMKFDAEANEKLTDPDNISVVLNSKKDDKNFEQTITVLMLEHDEEILRQKEQHLQTLGLVTHKAAEKRRIEVQQSSAANVEASKAAVAAAVVQQPQTHYGKRNGKHTATTQHTVTTVTSIGNHSNALSGAPTITTSTTSHPEYTGTLKTVIKLSRNSTGYAANGATNRRKSPQTVPAGIVTAKEQQPPQLQQQHRRQSLKMTFQKGRGRAHGQSNGDRHQHNDRENNAEDNYYTIQNENEESNNSSNNNSNQQTNQSLSNTNNSNNNTANNNNNNHNNNNNNNKIVEQEEILIPEKASSFKFHPGRLCEDQCFYCSGTFGLYDTPCHVGQIKSKERQQKILASEEKLTVDNCLCDACFRHVDRRANVPSYKKRIIVLQDNMGPSTSAAAARKATNETQANENETNNNFNNNHNNGNSDLMVAAQNGNNTINNNNETHENIRNCMVNDCMEIAAHSLRRKCLRKNAKKFLLNFEMPPTAPILWLCQTHYDAATRGLACVLCKRRLAKHYMYRVSDIDRLQKTLAEMGIPVKLGSSRATCKLCRYFANLLTKPTASNKSAEKVEFIQNYRKRLLQFHNIHIDSSEPSEADEEDSNGASVVEVLTANVLQKSPLTEKALNVLEDDPLTIKGDLMITKSIMNSSEIGANSTVITMAVNHNNLNNNKNTMSVENITHETMDRDCECTPLNTDSSSSSSNLSIEISNKNALTTTATTTIQSTDSMSIPLSSPNDTQQMSKLKAILQNNTQTILLPSSVEKKNNKSPTTDISTVLRANPNLSMRELFPGEEDLGLHFKVPFGISNSQRTPEGWTRVDTFLQYDEATRRLWEELQKPYGNQSSFLRHLILLEKYYRNGDLILSPNASSNASVYTQTVRQRLTSFDQGHCGGLQEAGTMDKTSEVASIKNQIIHELEIPTVEINEEDDEDEQAVIVDRNNKNDNVIVTSPDVEVRPIPKRQSASGSSVLENKTTKHQAIQRSRSLSVDKLTKQLNTQAVTIIARPKDHMYPKTNSSNGSNNGGYNANKTNIGSPQKSLLKDNLMVPIMTTSSNSISQCSTPTHTNLVAPNLSGSSTTLSASTNANLTSNSNSRSILKCNLLGINKSVEILPVLSCNASNTGSSDSPSLSSISNKTCAPVNLTSSRNINTYTSATGPITSEVSKQHVILDAANKLVQAAAAAGQGTVKNPPNAASLLSSPPELVSLHRRSITNQPASIASCRNNGSSNHNNIIPSNNSNTNKRLHVIGKTGSSRPAPNVVILPDTLTPQERMQSKSWRPTLMPVKENLNLFNKSGPLYQTADGRRLPGLVQVQSGGKPFLISIFDYNRMCILRREKLMRDQMLKATKKRQEDKKQQQSQQQQHQQQPQIAKTNVTHVHKNATNQANATSRQQQQQQQQHHQQQVAQQQLLQLQLLQQHQQALLKAAGNSNALNASGLNVTRYQPTTSKQPNGTTTSATASVTNIINSDINTPPPLSSTNATFSTPMIPLLANAISSATNNCTSWLWNNFPDANQLLMNGIGCTGTGVSMAATITNANANNGSTTSTSISMPKLPHLLTSKNSNACVTTSSMPAITLTHANAIKQQQQQHQQQLLLSKIPKSLTVIPQHKLMNVPASTALGTNISTTNTQNNMKE